MKFLFVAKKEEKKIWFFFNFCCVNISCFSALRFVSLTTLIKNFDANKFLNQKFSINPWKFATNKIFHWEIEEIERKRRNNFPLCVTVMWRREKFKSSLTLIFENFLTLCYVCGSIIRPQWTQCCFTMKMRGINSWYLAPLKMRSAVVVFFCSFVTSFFSCFVVRALSTIFGSSTKTTLSSLAKFTFGEKYTRIRRAWFATYMTYKLILHTRGVNFERVREKSYQFKSK